MVSNTFAKSIGYGGSKPIKDNSVSHGGGMHRTITRPEDKATPVPARPVPAVGGKPTIGKGLNKGKDSMKVCR